MGYWARPPQARGQQILFSTTLDDVIMPDHPVRLIGELLDGFDWTTWEREYHGSRGKPPIHPRVLAGLWLYGLRRGVRSSRKLEYMARNNIDFLWLAEGHSPDHSTLSSFRSQFGEALKELFRHVLRVAMAAGLLRLIDVATDGTRVKASHDRSETWTAKEIATVIDQLVKEFETKLAETPFALIKQILGLRQFLLRGLDKVKLEWLWTCTAINLDKLARGMARLRTQLEAEAIK